MNELVLLIVLLLVLAAILAAIVLPIVALVISVRSRNRLTAYLTTQQPPQGSATSPPLPISDEASLAVAVRQLQSRVAKLEGALASRRIATSELVAERGAPEQAEEQRETRPVAQAERPAEALPPSPTGTEFQPADTALPPPVAPASPFPVPIRKIQSEELQSLIGRRGLGWAAVCLILLAAAFFLKYAFENRWIGELGRVAIGIAAGVSMTTFGFKYYKRGWRVFSQILTGGGIVLLYLSAYAAFGYYHLASQKVAFVYLAILIAEAACLAFFYNAPAIAIMALIGGFLNPILLHSERDQYRSLFGYIVAVDIGALALLKQWKGLTSLAFVGSHLLFWLWYAEKYHPRKLGAVMVFQSALFLIFLLAHLGRRLIRRKPDPAGLSAGEWRWVADLEELGLLLINPFVFFATAYQLLNPNHHDWMGTFAIGMALLYAGAAKVLLDRSATTRSELLSLLGIALTFVTIAMPIQLRQNWITIAWSVEALLLLWIGLETKTRQLLALSYAVFGLVLIRVVFWDTPGFSRPMFTPVLNRYFLSSLIVTACLFGAAILFQRASRGGRQEAGAGGTGRAREFRPAAIKLVFVFVAIATFWFLTSVETYTFFEGRAASRKLAEEVVHERWLGQMALSVLWSVYAGVLAAIGFLRRSESVRWASLALFGITVIKVMLVDIAALQQFYRIVVFFVLGVLLLVVAWGYHKAFYARDS